MSVVATETQKERTAGVARLARNNALDWTKGALIVFMVIYHAINYSKYRVLAFDYLAFLPPSFILITGYIVGQVYASRYDLTSWKPYLRLVIRGLKLLILFTLFNVLNCIARERSLIDGLWEFADRSGAIYLSRHGRAGIFEVLLPISYFLLLAPALLWLRGRISAVIPIVAGAIFLLCFALERKGITPYNLSLLSAGLIGMAFGLIRAETMNRLAAKCYPALLFYIGYRLCSCFWGEPYWVQTFGVVATVFLLYGIAIHLSKVPWLGKTITVLGCYSLFGYLAQIALLRSIVHLCGGTVQTWPLVIGIILLTTALLVGLVFGADWLQRKNCIFKQAYKAVFA
jgi:hypothetical protein